MERKIIYRQYQDGDLSGINKIFHAAFCDYNFGPFRICELKSPQYLKWKYLDRPGFKPETIQIAEYNGKIIGMAIVTFNKLYFEGQTYKIGSLNNFSVCPKFQKQKIGSILRKKAFDYIKSEGCSAAAAIINPNGYLRNFCYRVGYKDVIYLRNWVKFIDFKNTVHYLPPFLVLFPIFFLLKINIARKKKKCIVPDLVIRYLKSSDLSDYLSLLNQSGSHLIGFPPYSMKYYKWWRLQRSKSHYVKILVATKNNRIVGGISLIGCTMYAGFRKLPYCLIPELFVDPSLRNKGIASLLLTESERIASQDGYGILSAFIHDQDSVYNAFMQRNGFFGLNKMLCMLNPIHKDFNYPKQVNKAWYVALEQLGY